MTKDEREVIEFCITSLKQEPEKWVCNEYKCVHTTDVTVWHANGPDAVGIYASSWLVDSERVGGLSTLAMLLMGGWLIPWRVRLYRAARAAWRGVEPERVKPAALIRSIIEAA